MGETRVTGRRPDTGNSPEDGYDSELDVQGILRFAAWLVAITIVVLLAMWWLSATFKKEDAAKDPPPSPLLEARVDQTPPGPRLQGSPPRDMTEMRARDSEALSTYGWVDQAGGVARIPVDRAMNILLQKGLPKTPDQKKEPK